MDSDPDIQVSQLVDISSVDITIDYVKSIIPSKFAELAELRKLVKALKAHEPGWVNELVDNYEKLKETIATTSNNLTKSHARNVERGATIKELSASLTVSRNRNSDLSVSNNILTKDNSNLLETNTELKTKNENLTKSYAIELSKLQDNNIELANELIKAQAANVEITTELESAKSRNNELADELETIKSRNVELSQVVENDNNLNWINVLEFLISMFIAYVSYLLLQ